MARPLRLHHPDGFYHVTLRGNHKQNIFQDDSDRSLLNKIVARSIATYGVRLHAYCWMTNHLHFLVQVGTEPLGGLMRQVASEYARAFQKRLETTGHLFERRYFARLVASEGYLWALVRYIHLNPVAGGLVTSIDGYPWSSHQNYSGRSTDQWVTTAPLLAMLAATRADSIVAYRTFMDCDPQNAVCPLDNPPRPPDAMRIDAKGAATTCKIPRSVTSLEQLISDACRRFGTSFEQLRSTSRDTYLMQVRGWIVKQAVMKRIANLSELSRALGRDRASLRNAMRRAED